MTAQSENHVIAGEGPPLSQHVLQALRLAKAIAANRGSSTIRSRHLLEGALSVRNCAVVEALATKNVLPRSVHDPLSDRDKTPMHDDDPARVDELHRRSFAEVLADRIRQVHDERGRSARSVTAQSGSATAQSGTPHPSGSFFMHIHGPWGTGKTSILGFIRDELRLKPSRKPYVVVEFNAWRYQRMRPPWWALIQEVYRQAVEQLEQKNHAAARRLRWSWFVWRLRADGLPVFLATASLVAVMVLTFSGVLEFVRTSQAAAAATSNPSQVAAATSNPSQVAATPNPLPPGGPAPSPDSLGKTFDLVVKILAGVLALWFAVLAASRSLVFGSARAAQAYLDLSTDPLSNIVGLFDGLVREIGYPVAILIDDLDRCDGEYVVQLLEGIQTLFRPAPVTYVFAADRNWIRTSFEKAYEPFSVSVGELGRPLGHLFLEKLFQLSVAVPNISRDVQTSYWRALLDQARGLDARQVQRTRQTLNLQAREIVGDRTTISELKQVIQQYSQDQALAEEIRSVAARKINEAPAQAHIDHLLQPYSDLVEPNPRAMKRLVNAFALQQAVNFMEHREVDVDQLARWTVLQMRWPLLADLLSANPHMADWIARQAIPIRERLPEGMEPLLRDQDVRAVFGVRARGDVAKFDENAVRTIVGLPLGADDRARSPGAVVNGSTTVRRYRGRPTNHTTRTFRKVDAGSASTGRRSE